MKRRNFLTAASTVGLVGTISASTIVSSAYSSISTNVLLEEFSLATKNVFKKMVTDVSLNLRSLGLDEKLTQRIVLPTKIVSKKSKGNSESITYKNRSGDLVSISVVNGVNRVKFSKTV